MPIRRIDLDGIGSPSPLADKIHTLLPELEPGFNVKALACELDIATITEQPVSGFEAMLVTDPNRRDGAIILAEDQSFKRRRFSISHELGHFLMAHHQPGPANRFECSSRDMALGSAANLDRRQKWEVEANRFAARLLMPLHKLKAELRAAPDLESVVALAERFKVSKDAMARTYAEHHDDPVAILVTQNGKFLRAYMGRDRFPWLALRKGDRLPDAAEYFSANASEGTASEIDDADPADWLSDPERDNVLVVREQVYWQHKGYALVMLEAELDQGGN